MLRRPLLAASLIFLSMALLLSSCTRQREVRVVPKQSASPAPGKTELVISAVGDVMMPVTIQASAARNRSGYELVFGKVSADLSGADITFANLETPVDQTKAISGYPKFNARPELLKALKKSGVTIVSIANNHALDAGSGGLARTIDNLDAAGLLFVGAGRTKAEAAEIKYVKARGLTVAFLAYTYSTNQSLRQKTPMTPGVNILAPGSEQDLGRAVTNVREARRRADIVVVSLHWGEEYAKVPTPWQRKVASELVEAGADVILGHHPHVLQPIESHAAKDGRAALVAFSLGNFISTQNAGITFENKDVVTALRGDGIILNVTAVKEGGRTRIDHAEFSPIWTLRELTGKGPLYRPVNMMKEIARIEEMGRRTPEQEDSLKLLRYRLDVIVNLFRTPDVR
jgi:poly-gamma-glutamate capsule biosynthesis protein CapA/YwtB (metallophosphatase superfamily)